YGGDPFFKGIYDEFRIWDGAMTPARAAASFAGGPNFNGGVTLQIILSAPNQVTISYPLSANDYTLQQATALLNTNTIWQAVTNAPNTNGSNLQVTLPVSAGNKFFRLRKP
ncbi:MAG: LamG domain-containing protein, partial [Verrucomicrobiota bacterium]|nr:LamG domain-containing protein [Verrucomicrobiota bacterium]